MAKQKHTVNTREKGKGINSMSLFITDKIALILIDSMDIKAIIIIIVIVGFILSISIVL